MTRRSFSAASVSLAALTALAAASACGEDRTRYEDAPRGFEPPSASLDAGECPFQCSLDGRSVVRSCTGEVVETCRPELACGAAKCQEPCAAAAADRSSNGCDFYFQPPPSDNLDQSCYAAFVVNTSTLPVDLTLERAGETLDVSRAMFRTAPGDSVLVQHDGAIPPGESVVLFVSDRGPSASNGPKDVPCPSSVSPAFLSADALVSTGTGSSFRLTTNAPISLVAMYPFGGAASHAPSATLILPTATWANQHVVVSAWEATAGHPTTQIVASEDDTDVTIVPTVDIQNGGGLKGTAARVPVTYRLARGQFLQFVQFDQLGGSIVESTKPTTVFGGSDCAQIPDGRAACDILGQQIPAFEQWGSEYAAVGYRPRLGDENEAMPYRIVAARDGTRLDYDPAIPAGAPTEMSAGQMVTFPAGTGDAFVVRTQDADHPIYLAAYMTSYGGGYFGSPPNGSWGDPEFVNVVPAGQYLSSYSFYADPSYDETSLVIVRAKNHDVFEDVWLECAGNLTDWRPIGTRGQYEFTRVDLTRKRGPGQTFGDKTCQAGLQRMKSEGPFTATLWGWAFAASYAYPGGMAQRKLVTTPLVPVQ